MLKKGGHFASYEWALTDKYREDNSARRASPPALAPVLFQLSVGPGLAARLTLILPPPRHPAHGAAPLQKHKEARQAILKGNGLPDLRRTAECLQALKDVGFEARRGAPPRPAPGTQRFVFRSCWAPAGRANAPCVRCLGLVCSAGEQARRRRPEGARTVPREQVVEECDLSKDSEVPWYLPIDAKRSLLTLEGFRTTWLGRGFTRVLVWVLETLGAAPKGSVSVSQFLEKGADALVEGGRCAPAAAPRSAALPQLLFGVARLLLSAEHAPPSAALLFPPVQGGDLYAHVFYSGEEAALSRGL